MLAMLLLQGVLVTYKGSSEIGRERFSDDGKTLISEITVLGQEARVSVVRGASRVAVVAAGKVVERVVPEGAIVLENGCWQQYALAAESHASARTPEKVRIFLPSQNLTLDGTIEVAAIGPGAAERRVQVHIGTSHGRLDVVAEVGADGAVRHVGIAAQSVEVRPAGAAAPVAAVALRAVPASVIEAPLAVKRAGFALHGVLWRPRALPSTTIKLPTVLIIAGSGPTDRDGNSALGLHTDAYRQLAEALVGRGIAVARFDKRGVGDSGMGADASRLALRDFIDDAGAFVALLRARSDVGALTVLGHSEGGVIAIELGLDVAQARLLDAVVLVASPGRPVEVLLREQLARGLSERERGAADRALATVKAGHAAEAADIEALPPSLRVLFAPVLTTMMASLLVLEPARDLERTRLAPSTPVTIVQGETDLQVSVLDARALAAARPSAKLVLVPRMNHVLKEEATRESSQRSYDDPSRPLVPALVDAVTAAVVVARTAGAP